MWQDFKKFIMRGNVADLAVAVVIGAAFGAVITALVSDLLTPLIAAIFGKQDFSKLTLTLNGSQFKYGDFINAIVAFVSIALVIFFAVVQPLNKLAQRAASKKAPVDPTSRKCPECLSEIPLAAKRCSFCTSKVTPAK